jgi:hypothetical protein
MSAIRRRELLKRLNTLAPGPTEDDRRAEREAVVPSRVGPPLQKPHFRATRRR